MFLLPAAQKCADQQHENHRDRGNWCDDQRVDLERLVPDADTGAFFGRLLADAAHEQAMRVDAVGRTRHECAVVLAPDGEQVGGFRREDGLDLVDAVGQLAVEDGNHERVADFKLVEVGKELRAWQTSVTGEDAVRALTPNRERGSLDVTDADLQNAGVGAVVDGQLDLDAVDEDVAHDAGTGDVEGLPVAGEPGRDVEGVRVGGKAAVVVVRAVEIRRDALLVDIVHGILIIGDHARGVLGVDVGADCGIQQHREPNEKHE